MMLASPGFFFLKKPTCRRFYCTTQTKSMKIIFQIDINVDFSDNVQNTMHGFQSIVLNKLRVALSSKI